MERMEGWIEQGAWAALVGLGLWLAWPRDVEPRWVRVLERGLPVRGWARRLVAALSLALSLFPFTSIYTPLLDHRVLLIVGNRSGSSCFGGCIQPWPRAPQGFSYARGRDWDALHTCTLRIGYWEARAVWVAGSGRG